jgi:hypothetical protein
LVLSAEPLLLGTAPASKPLVPPFVVVVVVVVVVVRYRKESGRRQNELFRKVPCFEFSLHWRTFAQPKLHRTYFKSLFTSFYIDRNKDSGGKIHCIFD